MDMNKHIWEGWTVGDFINELDEVFQYSRFDNKEEVKKWCMDNQPYYKKHIPEVYNYFRIKAGL
jgi:hypothetical protein